MGVALPSGATHSAAVANHAHGAERAFARQTAPCPVRCLSYKASIPHNPKRAYRDVCGLFSGRLGCRTCS